MVTPSSPAVKNDGVPGELSTATIPFPRDDSEIGARVRAPVESIRVVAADVSGDCVRHSRSASAADVKRAISSIEFDEVDRTQMNRINLLYYIGVELVEQSLYNNNCCYSWH